MNAHLFRTRVAVLWVAVSVAVVGSVLLYMVVPGALEEMLGGEMEGEPLDDAMGYFFAALTVIPLAMAAMTLLVGERLDHYLNLFGVYAVVGHVMDGGFNGHVLMAAVAGALAFLIAGLGMVGLRKPRALSVVRPSEPSRHRQEATL